MDRSDLRRGRRRVVLGPLAATLLLSSALALMPRFGHASEITLSIESELLEPYGGDVTITTFDLSWSYSVAFVGVSETREVSALDVSQLVITKPRDGASAFLRALAVSGGNLGTVTLTFREEGSGAALLTLELGEVIFVATKDVVTPDGRLAERLTIDYIGLTIGSEGTP